MGENEEISHKDDLWFIGDNPSHMDPAERRKMMDFQESICDFYIGVYQIYKEALEKYGTKHFLYVGENFVGLGEVGSKIIEIAQYTDKKDFYYLIEGLSGKCGEIGVFASENNKKELENMVSKAARELNLDYIGGFIRSKSEGSLTFH